MKTFFKSFLLQSSFYSNILYLVRQCKPSRGRKRGICWCVDKYGVQLPGTDYSGGDIQCKDLESSNNNEWKSGRDHLQPPVPVPPPPLTTTWPRARASSLNHTCMLRPPFTSRSLVWFFFSNRKKKKEEEKRNPKRKNRLNKRHLCFILIFFFILFFCRRPSTHLRMRGKKVPEDFTIGPVTVALVDPPRTRQVRWLQVPWKYMHPMDIFFIEAGGFNIKHFVWCKKRKLTQNHCEEEEK